MRIATPADAVYTVIARLPFLLLLAAVVWVMTAGIGEFQHLAYGGDARLQDSLGPSAEQTALDAVNSGDVDQMTRALEQLEAGESARAGR